MTIQFIRTETAPLPRGHYSQATAANGFVFVAGQLPVIPGPEHRVPEGIRAQTRQVLQNIAAVLHAAGSAPELTVSVQVFVADPSMWSAVNEEYEAFFGAHRPARTVVPVGPLSMGALIEVNAIAVDRAGEAA